MGFEQSLAMGQAGESANARFFRARDFAVLPVYEKIIDTGKGPQVFLKDRKLVAPDLFVWKGRRIAWVEAKHKSAFTWHRNSERWTTGIDRHHYNEYLKVQEASPWPVWLMFLHRPGFSAKDSPAGCPSGLFANDLRYLSKNVNHISDNWGRFGMVYWAEDRLKLIADYEDVMRVSK